MPLLFNLLLCGVTRAVTKNESANSINDNVPQAIAWFSLKAGKICLGKKLTTNAYDKLKLLGVTHVATVQTGDENAPEVRDATLNSGLEWLWVPYSHPSSPSLTDDVYLHQYLNDLSKLLSESANIYLHCDGSQHRCSLLLYALCHYLGIPSSSAYNVLHSFGRNAANGLSRAELTWAAKLGHSAPRL